MTYLIDTQKRDVPVPALLQDWAAASAPAETPTRDGRRFDMAFWSQILFVRDQLPKALGLDYEHWGKAVTVVSTHTSKSVLLPVYRVDTDDGLVLWLRENHYNWKVSVASVLPIDAEFEGLTCGGPIKPHDCEGFAPDWVFGPYQPGATAFTVEILDEYRLWTFCHLLGAAVRKRVAAVCGQAAA